MAQDPDDPDRALPISRPFRPMPNREAVLFENRLVGFVNVLQRSVGTPELPADFNPSALVNLRYLWLHSREGTIERRLCVLLQDAFMERDDALQFVDVDAGIRRKGLDD